MTTWPILSKGEDAKYYGVEYEDVTIAAEMEGGYVVTRPRHTRKPRRTWTTGYSSISQSDLTIWETFFDSIRGGSLAFDWTNPVTSVVHSVRLKAGEMPRIEYRGAGTNYRYDITNIKLEEV